MAARSTLRTWLRHYLGVESDDPAFSDAILNPILQQAADSLVADIQSANRSYLSADATLSAVSATSHSYTLATQSPAITNFSHWLAVRYDDEDGLLLNEARLEDLQDYGADYFAIVGVDEAATLVTSPDSEAGSPLWFRYGIWPAEMSDDNSVPGGIPSRYHDIVSLEATFAYGLGGEQSLPAELRFRWLERRGQLLSHVSRRGVQPSRSRIYSEAFE